MNLTKTRLNNYQTDNAHIENIKGHLVLFAEEEFGKQSGFYFITDYKQNAIHVSYVGDDIGTNNAGFMNVISELRNPRTKKMTKLRSALNRRVFEVHFLELKDVIKMIDDFMSSQYFKPEKMSSELWSRYAMFKIKINSLHNDFRPLRLIIQDLWIRF